LTVYYKIILGEYRIDCQIKVGGMIMRTLFKAAQAGTVESGDILIMVAPAAAQAGIAIELASPLCSNIKG
jgi:hypothetical protein